MEFIMISIFRPGKSWNLLWFRFSGLGSHGIYYDFNFQVWKVMEFIMISIFRPGKSWNLL